MDGSGGGGGSGLAQHASTNELKSIREEDFVDNNDDNDDDVEKMLNMRSTSIGGGSVGRGGQALESSSISNRPPSRASNSSSGVVTRLTSGTITTMRSGSDSTTTNETITDSTQAVAATAALAMFEYDRVSLNSIGGQQSNNANNNNNPNSSKQQNSPNISTTAFSTFVRLIQSLGPVLTCKYCCSDLFKMLAICYMNSRCLLLIETSG